MTFCQKHENHHCVHSHNCGSHKHQICKNTMNRSAKNIKNDPAADIFRRNSKKLQKITEQNQEVQCHFTNSSSYPNKKSKCRQCQSKQKQIQKNMLEVTNLKKEHSEKQKKYTKIMTQNRQLQGVVEYYRSQMDRIIKCGQLDVKNEIKRHMKENTQLSAKNKFLLHKLNQVEQALDKLANQNQQLHKKLGALRVQKQSLITTYESLVQRLRKNYNKDANKDMDLSIQKKKNSQIQYKYQIIIQQLKNKSNQAQKQNRRFSNQNKQLSHQIQMLSNKIKNSQKLQKIQLQSLQQREIVLKKKLQACQKQIKDSKDFIIRLQNTLKLKDQQILYSKKVIQKQLKSIKQNKDLYNQINKNIQETSKQNRKIMKQEQQRIVNKLEKDAEQNSKKNKQQDYRPKLDRFGENRINQQAYITSLKDQIIKLKQRITFLQSQPKGGSSYSNQTIQQYILKIGASQAFRKIIQQKNQYIKKLIRQKGVLYQKI